MKLYNRSKKTSEIINMEVTKIEAGEYKVNKDNEEYLVSKDSYTGTWSIYHSNKFLTYKNTKKACLDFIEKGHSVKLLDGITIVPPVELDTHFKVKTDATTVWTVRDVIYSSRSGKWRIKGSYYNDSIDSGSCSWNYDDFENECELTSDGCGRSY